MKDVFEKIYKTNAWRGETPSGVGSNLANAYGVISGLGKFFHQHDINTLIDAPCGVYHWMRVLMKEHTEILRYIGFDLVDAIIAQNKANNPEPYISFAQGDISQPLPPFALPDASTTLVLTRDCFIHLPYATIFKTLKNLLTLPGDYYAFGSYPDFTNIDCAVGGYRPLNMRLAPFNFPEPLVQIKESDALTEDGRLFPLKMLYVYGRENLEQSLKKLADIKYRLP